MNNFAVAPRLNAPRTFPAAPVLPTWAPTLAAAPTIAAPTATTSSDLSFTRAALLQLGIDPMTPGMLATQRDVLPGPAPYFTQMQPLPNWEVNCVPTSVAMVLTKLAPRIAAALAVGANGVFDANQLIHGLSSWMVAHQDGKPGLRNFSVLAGMLRGLGVPAEAVHGLPLRELRYALAVGRQAIVMGDALALPSSSPADQQKSKTEDALHALVVTAQDPRTGNFLINDPQDPERRPRWVSESELVQFVAAVGNNIDGARSGTLVLVG